MSLIPYYPREGREVVLRHRNALVVRDATSHRLEIRGIDECPTCHQPLPGNTSSDRPFDRPFGRDHESYVNPDYFRMLHSGVEEGASQAAPSSPIQRVLQPVLDTAGNLRSRSSSPVVVDDDSDFEPSSSRYPYVEGSKIRKNSFSPNYFKTFFVEEKVLGRGGKGVVLLVRHEIDGCFLGHFACKRVPVGDDHTWLEKVLVEVELLAKLSHPNMVSYRHVWLEDVQLSRFGPSVACAFILQQYCNGGDLHQYVLGAAPRESSKEELKARMRRRSKGQVETPQYPLSAQPRLSFEEIYSLFKDITSGVAYLHASNYVHRDLKPSNCLLHQDGGRLVCLISDFGEVQPEHVVRRSSGSTGTISYCAPEVLKVDTTGRYGNFTTKSDVFSLGMILYFMCFGRLPYRSANALQEELEDIDELRSEISDWKGFQGERRERPDLPSKLYQLLQKLLALDPVDRPSASEILSAMKTEGNFDSNTRDRNSSPSINLVGGRIQNLDSPAPPASPIPRNQGRHVGGPASNTSPSEISHDNAFSPGDGSTLKWKSSSTGTQSLSQQTRASEEVEHGSKSDPEPARVSAENQRSVSFATPLLMAPPQTSNSSAAVANYLAIISRRTLHMLGFEGCSFGQLMRIGVFLAKVAALCRRCWPFMMTLQVGIPLILVAAFDLREPKQKGLQNSNGIFSALGSPLRSPLFSLFLFVLHLGVISIASRWGTLCVTRPSPHWDEWHGA